MKECSTDISQGMGWCLLRWARAYVARR
jgi:hypothetical protein